MEKIFMEESLDNKIREDDLNFPPEVIRNHVGLLEVRTAPYTSTIIVDPCPFEGWVYEHGKPVQGAPESWQYLGCPLVLTREQGESDKDLLARAEREADAIRHDGKIRHVDY